MGNQFIIRGIQQFCQQMESFNHTLKKVQGRETGFGESSGHKMRALQEISLNQGKERHGASLHKKSSGALGRLNTSSFEQLPYMHNKQVPESKWQEKVKELNQQTTLFTKQSTLMREEFKVKYENILSELKQKNLEISELTSKNYSLTFELQEVVNDTKLLSQSYEILKEQNMQFRSNEKVLCRQNNDLLLDSRKMVDEFQKCVATIEKLFQQLGEQTASNGQKDALLKQLSESNSYFQLHLNHCAKEIQKYQRVVLEINASNKKNSEQANYLDMLREDHELLINRLQRENLEIREALERQLKSQQQAQGVIQELKDRNAVLERRFVVLEDSERKLTTLIQEKNIQIEEIRRVSRDRVAELRLKLSEAEEYNEQIKEELVLNNRQLEEQLESQHKRIEDYEKASKLPGQPKQLNAMKDKIKNGDRQGGFKLNQFQMKVYLDHSSPLHSQENCARRDRDNVLQITDRAEDGRKSRAGRERCERSNEKTVDATERAPSQI